MKYEAILFDFDYTLGDSTPGIVASVNYAMVRMGEMSYSEDQIRKTVGLSLSRTYEKLTGDSDQQRSTVFAAHFREESDRVMAANTVLLPGVRDILAQLRTQPVKLGVVTTKYHRRIVQIFDIYKECIWFDGIVGCDDVSREKPDPEGVLKLLDEWKLEKSQALYVGDSLVDAKTAAQAGIAFAAVTTGTTPAEDFEPYPCINVMRSLGELPALLK